MQDKMQYKWGRTTWRKIPAKIVSTFSAIIFETGGGIGHCIVDIVSIRV